MEAFRRLSEKRLNHLVVDIDKIEALFAVLDLLMFDIACRRSRRRQRRATGENASRQQSNNGECLHRPQFPLRDAVGASTGAPRRDRLVGTLPLLQLHRMCSPREFPYAVSEHWCAVAPQPIAAALPCRFTLR
jgi:hypothetical protein